MLLPLLVTGVLVYVLFHASTPPPDCKHKRKPKKEVDQLSFTFELNNYKLKFKGKIMALSMTDTQQAVATIKLLDKKGYETPVSDGMLVVSVDDESIATVELVGGELTVKAVAPGVATGLLEIDPDNNDSTLDDDFSQEFAIEILPGQGVSASIVFGAPTEQEEESTTSSTTEETTVETTTEAPIV